MLSKRHALLLALIAVPALCMARGNIRVDSTRVADRQPDNPRDTMTVEERNKLFYDSLAVKSERKGFTRFLYKILVIPSTSAPADHTPMTVTDEAAQYADFEGLTIRSVEIVTGDVFERPVSYLEKFMNAAHIITRKGTIRRDMLFREGDALNSELLVKNKQLLASRGYLYNVDIMVTPSEDNPSEVDVKIVTRDGWTINGDGSITGLSGRMYGDIFDVNLLGTGNKLRYRLSLDWRNGRYEGSLFEYSMPNMFGSFFTGRFQAGRSFLTTEYLMEINKRLVLNDDYGVGLRYDNLDTRRYILYADSERFDMDEPVKYSNIDIWVGKSFRLPSLRSNIYGMVAYYGTDFRSRPDYTGKGMNPAFHNRSMMLASLGMYRERFLTANMIYGYGMKEYIATGYKAEITGGYMSGEFDEGAYFGASLRAGKFTEAGYFMASASIGGFYDAAAKRIFQSALSMRMDYFTNLIRVGSTNIRQFVSANYVKGWNRAGGVDEWIRLTKESGPRGMQGYYVRGRERAVLNTETVVFTPWQPLGFRIALYGYWDAGLIGDNRNLFRNDFYSSIGIGIRLKNEMFVFDILQLNLSVALNGNGFMRNDEWILLNEGTRMQSMRYIPEQPRIVEYR
jgi:hypothetical protein